MSVETRRAQREGKTDTQRMLEAEKERQAKESSNKGD